MLNISSVSAGRVRRVDVPLDIFDGGRASYQQVRAWFDASPDRHWAAYVAGVFHVLVREESLALDSGAAVLVESDVPEGKGVSSSAAIEAATMEAVLAAWSLPVDPRMRAIRCQQVENLVVGAPCGVMDQMASICGEQGRSWRCSVSRPSSRARSRFPDGLACLGHRLGHPPCGDRRRLRRGARRRVHGLSGARRSRGLSGDAGRRPRHVRVEDPRWHGYLANVTPDVFAGSTSASPSP